MGRVGTWGMVGAMVLGLGCGSSNASTSASSSSSAATGTTSAAGATTAGAATGGTAGSSSAGTASGSSSAGGGTGVTSGATAGGTAGGASTGGDSSPIANLTANTWTWVPFPAAVCRLGAPTGIAVNPNPNSTRLVIFLQGGGSCQNAYDCPSTPTQYGADEFGAQFGSGHDQAGILSRTNSANPVQDWNLVFVPYCTGDVHTGDVLATPPGDAGPQQYRGYSDFQQFLRRLVPTFPNLTEVLLAGDSAGGAGAESDYILVARAFAPVPVNLLDDSAPAMSTTYYPQCLQDERRVLWNTDATVVADCGADCADGGNLALVFQQHLAATYPDRRFGLVEATADVNLSHNFAQGAQNCAAVGQQPALAPEVFDAGLAELRTLMAPYTNWGSFYVTSADHTSIQTSQFYSRQTSAGLALTTWVAQLVDGGLSNAGP